MLPSWMNDLAIVVTLVTGIPVIIGCVLGWLAQGNGPVVALPIRSNQDGSRRPQSQSITLLGSFKTGVLDGIIRPDIPISTEVVRAAFVTFLLPVATIFYHQGLNNVTSRGDPASMLLPVVFWGICLYALFLILVWARLIWKRDYLNRISEHYN
jgi:hypothetical protein